MATEQTNAKNTQKSILEPSKWVSLFGDYLFSFAMMKVGSRDAAEDLVQDTFLSAMKGKVAFHGESSEKTWLVAILKNKIIDHYRKKDVLKNASGYVDETQDEFSERFFDRTTGHWMANATPQPWTEFADRAVNAEEFNLVLQSCIHKMPSKLIPVFVAKFIDDEDSEVICKVHNISSSNYWVMIHRAKVLIRSCLEKNWFLTKK